MIKTYYRASLPHILPIGATFFITFRIQGSLPFGLLEKLKSELAARIIEIKASKWLNPNDEIYKNQKLFFKKYDTALDKIYNGVEYLKIREIAEMVTVKIHQFDGELYDLLAYCIMPNHVHLLIDTSCQVEEGKINEKKYIQLEEIMRLIKGGSSYYVNKFLGKTGKFWQKESYDHYVRNGKELSNIIWYIVQNPVKAKLVKSWEEYEFTYVKNTK